MIRERYITYRRRHNPYQGNRELFDPGQYELIDFGDGRRLESFGGYRIDRPCPVAEGMARQAAGQWSSVDARYNRTDGDTGFWNPLSDLPEFWLICGGSMKLELRRTPFGHVGVFPEQATNWDWLQSQISKSSRPLKVLNLFAYTGGATLAVAANGAMVTHIDAAKSVVNWARSNAAISGLSEAPVRWIVEDALKFVRRENRRGNTYDAIIMDPPSYGHGPKGETWRIERDLPDLLSACAEVTEGQCRFWLTSCHTPGLAADQLAEWLVRFAGLSANRVDARPLDILSRYGQRMPCGTAVRWGEVEGRSKSKIQSK